jgi:hypothetical protein
MSADGNFETNPYVAALMDLTEGAPTGTFMSILVRDLIAKTAMIERIFSHKIRIQKIGDDEGAIYGGGFDQNGNTTGGPGVYIGTNGKLKAVDGEFSGRVVATEGEFRGTIHAIDGEFEGSIYPTKGIFGSWYWGVAVTKTQNEWFQVFKDRIPIGKRLNVFGGGQIRNNSHGSYDTGVFCFIERLNINTIEINMFPINTSYADYLTIVPCTRGNNNIVSYRHYIGW